MILRIYLTDKNGNENFFDHVTKFSFYKEAYTPYTKFSAVFMSNNSFPPEDCASVKFMANGLIIHHGIIDTCKRFTENGVQQVAISSRGYTSLLTENQLPPGMYNDISINSLFNGYFSFPNVTHEQNAQSSYIFVKRGTPIWDGVANLSYKLTGNYPYIRSTNTVMMSMPESPGTSAYDKNGVVSYGSEINTRRLVSDFHMEDISGNYGTYDCIIPEALSRGIVRHRYYELDKRFLSAPQLAGEFRAAVAMKSYKRYFFTYPGYNHEDINDIVSFDNINKKRVKAVRITGDQRGIFTELSVYEDKFSQ